MKFATKIRIFLIAVLALLVVGMTMLGVLGFNQSVDNKASYEMQVSVDQVTDKAVEVLENSSKTAIESIDSIAGEYSVQKLNDGAVIIYKFNEDVTANAETVKTAVQTALTAENLNINADVKVYENLGNYQSQTAKAVLAIGIAIVVIFAYALILNKLSGGVAVLCSSVLSVLLFTALMAITRIPAQPYLAIFAAISAALSSALAAALTTRYSAIYKAEDKMTSFQVTESVNKSFRIIYVALGGLVLLSAIIAGAIGVMNSLFLGLGILVAGVSGIASAIYMTPFIWALVKGKRK